MNFSQWLENNEIQEVLIKDLIMTKEEIKSAVSNLARGLPSMTEGPLFVMLHPSNNRYQLTNGYHRVVEALMNHKTYVSVRNIDNANWKLPSKKELFIPDFSLPFFGMEKFIEYYELKNI